MSEFVIVGGGVAGLVTARRLALGGATVTVLEASDRFGGIVAEHTVGGISLDAGAESFATRGNTVAALAEELGLDVVAPLDSPAWLYRTSGEPVPLPATSVLGIPGVPLANDVIAAVGFGAAFRGFLDILLPAGAGLTSGTLGGLVRTRMGAAMLEGLVTPVVRGVHSAHPDELQLDQVAPFLRAELRREGSLSHAVRSLRESAPAGSAIAGIRGGVHLLASELVADLDRPDVTLRTGARVDSVAPDAVTVGGETVRGTIVLAASGLREPNAGRQLTLATLVVDAPGLDAAPRGTGLLVADGAPGIRARALTHSTAKWPWLAELTGGRHVLRLSYDGHPSGLAETAREDAARLLGITLSPSSVADFATVQWTRPTPEPRDDEFPAVGEAVGGTGLAAVVAYAEGTAARLLAD